MVQSLLLLRVDPTLMAGSRRPSDHRVLLFVLIAAIVSPHFMCRNPCVSGGLCLQLASTSVVRSSRPLAGSVFVGGRGAAPDFITHLMLNYPAALTLVGGEGNS